MTRFNLILFGALLFALAGAGLLVLFAPADWWALRLLERLPVKRLIAAAIFLLASIAMLELYV